MSWPPTLRVSPFYPSVVFLNEGGRTWPASNQRGGPVLLTRQAIHLISKEKSMDRFVASLDS